MPTIKRTQRATCAAGETMTKEKNTMIGKVKVQAPKSLLTEQEKKDWQTRVKSDGWLKRFIDDMERLEVGACIDVSLEDPRTGEKVVSQTLTTSLYKPKGKKK